MKYKLIDNCLNNNDFSLIKDTMLGADFPWFFNSCKVNKKDGELSKYNFQFTHNFYSDFSPKSLYLEMINPLLVVLDPSAVVRIKANLIPVTDELKTYDQHVDFENFKGKTAIYYINDNDGYTIFNDGEKVYSKANRLIIFDSQLSHAGTNCTDQKARCLINFNFYGWENG